MKKLLVLSMAVCLCGAGLVNAAMTTIDFEGLSGSYPSYTISGVTFSAVGGGNITFGDTTPNGSTGIVNWNNPHQELRGDIGTGATFVSVDLGDYDADADRLFLEVFDSSNTSLGFTDLWISSDFVGMQNLSLSAPNIAYAVFGARDAVSGSSVFADNFTFTTGEAIPAPGAILLGSIGVGLVGWLRKRRTL